MSPLLADFVAEGGDGKQLAATRLMDLRSAVPEATIDSDSLN
jgi:hypothetical protein